MKLKQLKPILEDQTYVNISVSLNSLSDLRNRSVNLFYDGPATNIPNEMLDYTIEKISAGYNDIWIRLKKKKRY